MVNDGEDYHGLQKDQLKNLGYTLHDAPKYHLILNTVAEFSSLSS